MRFDDCQIRRLRGRRRAPVARRRLRYHLERRSRTRWRPSAAAASAPHLRARPGLPRPPTGPGPSAPRPSRCSPTTRPRGAGAPTPPRELAAFRDAPRGPDIAPDRHPRRLPRQPRRRRTPDFWQRSRRRHGRRAAHGRALRRALREHARRLPSRHGSRPADDGWPTVWRGRSQGERPGRGRSRRDRSHGMSSGLRRCSCSRTRRVGGDGMGTHASTSWRPSSRRSTPPACRWTRSASAWTRPTCGAPATRSRRPEVDRRAARSTATRELAPSGCAMLHLNDSRAAPGLATRPARAHRGRAHRRGRASAPAHPSARWRRAHVPRDARHGRAAGTPSTWTASGALIAGEPLAGPAAGGVRARGGSRAAAGPGRRRESVRYGGDRTGARGAAGCRCVGGRHRRVGCVRVDCGARPWHTDVPAPTVPNRLYDRAVGTAPETCRA